jgi:hypothetical protein
VPLNLGFVLVMSNRIRAQSSVISLLQPGGMVEKAVHELRGG